MVGYRLYFLDATGHIAARDEFEADSDESAIEGRQPSGLTVTLLIEIPTCL